MINKRIFGSPIPLSVQKKLEARQLAAVGDKKPLDEINSNYKDKRPANYKYNELLASNFDMEADLSSRTPFARLWTGVALVNERDFEVKSTEDSTNSTIADDIEKSKTKDNDLDRINSLVSQIKYKELERTVYIIGTNNLSTLDNSLDPNNSQQNEQYSAIFPPEHQVDGDNNKFLKPAAGITSVSSETEGIMGSIKRTTIGFTVHNFHDYDKIYSKFFLRPGAQVFVDFGWDTLKDSSGNPIKLYDPREILDLKSVDNQYSKDEKVEHRLYGQAGIDEGIDEDGFVTKCNGDVETLVGIVTDYDVKILPNGSVECSLTMTSKNSALMQYPKHVGGDKASTNAKFEFDLDNLIFYEQTYNLGGNLDRTRLTLGLDKVANSDMSVENELGYETFMNETKWRSYGSKSFVPTAMAMISGLFVVGDEVPTNSYIQWGFLEDRIFNRYFGHGDDSKQVSEDKEGKFTVRLDSSDGFTAFEKGFLYKQAQVEDAPSFLIPYTWDISYNTPRNGTGRQKSGLTDSQRMDEFTNIGDSDFTQYADETTYNNEIKNIKTNFKAFIKERYKNAEHTTEIKTGNASQVKPVRVYTDAGFVTKFDKKLKRVPIRDIFVNIDLVKEAFKNDNNNSFREVVQEILDGINDDSYGLWDWQLVGEENILKINDMNFSHTALGTVDQRTSEFNKIFKFNVMSKDSIVTNYDVSFEMPDGDIGSMYAIQAMTGTPAKMDPITTVVESHSALQTILNKYKKDLKKVGFRYLPDMGAYNALNMASAQFNAEEKIKYYREIAENFKPNTTDAVWSQGVAVVNPNVVWDKGTQDKSKKKMSSLDNDINFNTEARIALSNKKAREEGKSVAGSIEDYYEYKITGEFITEEHFKAIPLPMKLEISLYGIATLKPGDIFRVDYLPELYMEYVYFQVLNVAHDVNKQGWYTTLETQFRISPHRYEDSNMFKAPATGDDEEQENLKNLLNEASISGDDADFLIKSVSLKENQQKPEPEPVVLDPSMLKGGDLLSDTIDDSRAYMWDDESTAFSTLFGVRGRSYWNRPTSGTFKPYSGGDWDWDYVKGSGTTPKVKNVKIPNKFGSLTGGPTWSVITNYNFASLKGFMKDLKEAEDIDGYDWIYKAFTFKISSSYPIYIANPMYYWSDEVNRYNGYGTYRIPYDRKNNNGKDHYVGGIYCPDEKVKLVINAEDPKRHWGVFPDVVSWSRVNFSTLDPRWSKSEWSDEGWANNNSPDQY